MTDRLDPARLDSLWDFEHADASAARFAEEIAAATSPAVVAELQTQRARALGLAGHGAEADALLASVDAVSPVVEVRLALERGRRLNSDGHPAGAVPLFVEALERAEASGEDFLAVDALHMLAIADELRSAEWAGRGIRFVEKSPDARTQRWSIALHNNLGWSHFDAERYRDALGEFELSLAAAERYGTEQQQQWAREAIAEATERLTSGA